ncbi:MAG: group II intron maturase-specific domain-containing protein, partial [Actinomycetota bacterium]
TEANRMHAVGLRESPSDPAHPGPLRRDAETVTGSPVLVRYADDYVAMCYSRQQAEEVKARLAAWLAPRGLSFLGCSIRRYVDRQGGKLLIRPSQESVRRFRERLAADVASLRGANAAAVAARLNPVVRGWSAYYRSVCPAPR